MAKDKSSETKANRKRKELPAQFQVLRMLSQDGDFRVAFFKDPIRAIASTDITISIGDLTPLTKITADQFETLTTITHSGKAAADGGEDLAYLAFCVVAFLLTIRPPEGLSQQLNLPELAGQILQGSKR